LGGDAPERDGSPSPKKELGARSGVASEEGEALLALRDWERLSVVKGKGFHSEHCNLRFRGLMQTKSSRVIFLFPRIMESGPKSTLGSY
jgi:hypothetical protein